MSDHRLTSIAVLGALLSASLTLAPPLAHADGAAAIAAYEQKDFATAFRGFQELAELGHPESQRNLAVMLSRGEGVLMSKRLAYAWMKLAADSGDPRAVAIEAQWRPLFAEAATAEVADIQTRFGPDRLSQDLLPHILLNCEYSDIIPPKLDVRAAQKQVQYPAAAERQNAEAFIMVEFLVAADGKARDYRVISGLLPQFWNATLADAMKQWSWSPATKDGKPISAIATVMINFTMRERREYLDYTRADRFVEDMHQKAIAGDADAQYIYGLLLSNHPKYRKPWSEALPWIQKAAVAGVGQAQFQLGYSLLRGRGCEADPAKALKWLQWAAAAGSPEAQVTLARLMRESSDEESARKPLLWLQRAARSSDRSAEQELAAMLATDPDADVRDPAEALRMSEILLKQEPTNPLRLEIRAAALAATGDYPQATTLQGRALELARKLQWDVAAMLSRQQTYAGNHAWTGRLLAY